MSKFWINFAISEAISLAQGLAESSNLNTDLKAALEGLISAGRDVLSKLHLLG